jgi:hypothetical protein
MYMHTQIGACDAVSSATAILDTPSSSLPKDIILNNIPTNVNKLPLTFNNTEKKKIKIEKQNLKLSKKCMISSDPKDLPIKSSSKIATLPRGLILIPKDPLSLGDLNEALKAETELLVYQVHIHI